MYKFVCYLIGCENLYRRTNTFPMELKMKGIRLNYYLALQRNFSQTI